MRPATRPVAALIAAVALVAALAVPASAKVFNEATLDAPIAMDTPPGTEILVGVTVVAPGADGAMHPVEGSPIRLILTGRDWSTTYADGAADGRPGHYLMRIEIPTGGARGAQVTIHGTMELVMLMADPFTFGGVTARTAQVAPPLTPRPPASAPAAVAPVAPVAPAPGVPQADPVGAAAPSGPPLVLGVGVAALAVSAALLLLALVRRAGSGRRADVAGRTPGA